MAENLLNVPKCNMKTFYDDLEARIALLTGVIDMNDVGLTLEQVRKPMLVIGQPGVGKTAGIMGIIKKFNETKLKDGKKLGFKKILLGQTVVGSMSGIPVVMGDGSVKRVQVPDLPDPEKDQEYGVLFLDEITTADEAQVQPALGLCDDSRNIGEYTLPEHWLVVAAGNGPDCTNFLRLDDMTISRFAVYDILYSFQSDWRGYANQTGINNDIIAFLNFQPDACIRVESNDNDISGRLFPCPRTWERLSTELKMRQAVGRPVPQAQMGEFAGRIVGARAGREFQAFTAYSEKVVYDPDKILSGEEEPPKPDMEKQVFFIMLQRCLKRMKTILEQYDDGTTDFDEDVYVSCANMIRWFLHFENIDLDSTFQAIISIRNDDKRLSEVLLSDKISKYCPELDDFIDNHFDTFYEIISSGGADLGF